MSASLAIAYASLAASSIAAQDAQNAQERSCKSYIKSFDSKIATIQESKEYAKCVDMVYPSSNSPQDIIAFSPQDIVALKILFLIALIGSISHMFYMRKDIDSPSDFFLSGLIGFIGLPVICSIIVGLICGILWLIGII